MSERPSRRGFLAGLASASALTLSGCASIVDAVDSSSASSAGAGDPSTETAVTDRNVSTPASSEPETDTPAETASEWSTSEVEIADPSMSLPAVDRPDAKPEYATMGTADETLTVYGNWKCPYTREFVLGQFPTLAEEFVASGDVSVRFRSVAYRGGDPFLGPDAPASTRAGLAVWETDADAYWDYFTYVFANQPQERYEWGQPSLLTRFAAEAGVEAPSAVREAAATESAYADRVQLTLDAANENDIWTVPRVVYDGEVTAPTLDARRTREQFEAAAED